MKFSWANAHDAFMQGFFNALSDTRRALLITASFGAGFYFDRWLHQTIHIVVECAKQVRI